MTISVLLVEDNPGDARLAIDALSSSKRDFEIAHVTSLHDAVNALKDASPDCVIMDLGLDDAEGFEGVSTLRTKTTVPVIVLTGHASHESAAVALEHGADDYLIKGELHDHTLERAVDYALERHALRDALRSEESRFRSLVENAFDGVAVVDRKGCITYASPRAGEILGLQSTPKQVGDRIHPDDLDRAKDLFWKTSAEADRVADLDIRLRHEDGTYRWVSVRARNRMEDPAVAGLVVNFHDSTERHLAADRIRESEALLSDAQAIAHLGSFVWDVKSRQATWSAEQYRIFGLEPGCGEVDHDYFLSLVHPEDRGWVEMQTQQCVETGEHLDLEYRIVQPDGAVRWIHGRGELVREGGRPVKLIGTNQDVTQRRKASDERAYLLDRQLELTEQFRLLLESTGEGIYGVDADGLCTFINPAGAEMLGYDPIEIMGKRMHELVHSDAPVPTGSDAVLRAVKDGEKSAVVEEILRRKDGSFFPAEYSAHPIIQFDRPSGAVVAFKDVSERQAMERELRASVELFQGAFRAARTGIALIDAQDDSYVDVNEALCDMLGFSKEELLHLKWSDVTHRGDLERSVGEVSDFKAGRREVNLVKKRYVRKDGSVISVEISDALVRSPDGAPRYFVSHVSDVTEREGAARALRESQELLQAVIDASPAAIYIKQVDGTYVLVNRRFLEIFELEPSAVVGKTDFDLFELPVASNLVANDRSVFEGGDPLEVEESVPVANGESRSYLSVKFPLLDQSGDCYALCGISTDITDRIQAQQERARLEEQLQQSQKLEAIGQLAGGVAHDFNNLLAVILNYAEFMSEDVASDDPTQENIAEIIRAAQLGAALTRQLLTFSRRDVTQPVVLDVNQVIKGMERLLSRTIRESINLTAAFEEDLWPVVADPGQVEQILMNLAVNAKDAMLSGGKLSIETCNVVVDRDGAAAHPDVGQGEYVCLSVGDTGIGMSEETRAHIFEPFFTTKPKESGTGLGLATVYGIVKKCGGYVTCNSEEGVGTTFKIYLPRSESVRLPRTEHPRSAPDRARGTVLIVEDSDSVRRIATRILEEAGYSVTSAATAAEALAALGDGAFDLLITDVVLPGGMSGTELARHFEAPTLFVSGYTDNLIRDSGGLSPDQALLQKPFSGPDLLRAAAEALSRGRGGLKVAQ